MKIAVAGKGGTGKTTVTTLITSYLAKEAKVLAFDIDSNENLAHSLGFSSESISKLERIRNFYNDIFDYTKTDYAWQTRKYTPRPEANYYFFKNGIMDPFLKRVTITKGNISVSHLGTVSEENRGIENMCESYTLMRIFLNHLKEDQKDFVIADLAAGNDLLTRATVMNMDEVILVVEPTSKNLTVAKDILISLEKLLFTRIYIVVNKSFDEKDTELVQKELGIDKKFITRIPFSQELLMLDNRNKLTYDSAPEEIRKEIKDLLEKVKVNKIDEEKLIKRAANIDARLFSDNPTI
ncbi:MAG TPA: AAA family ATPase [Candidatus Sulfotelmatobacter sp.]|nr:AAA family ATPase [Candidatus Sulfotelmatobacter sp.]